MFLFIHSNDLLKPLFSYKYAVPFFHSTQKLKIHQRALTLLHVTSASLDCLLLFCPLLGDSALRWVSSPLWLFLADTDFLPGDLLPLEPFPADLVLSERDSCLFLYIWKKPKIYMNIKILLYTVYSISIIFLPGKLYKASWDLERLKIQRN